MQQFPASYFRPVGVHGGLNLHHFTLGRCERRNNRETTMSDTKFARKRRANKAGEDVKKQTKPPVSFNLRFSDLWENPEVVISKMASSSWLSKAGSWIPQFLLAKFPYVQALTLIMLMAERALKMEKFPPMHPYLIYTVAAVSLLMGVLMSAKITPKFAAMVYCVVLAYLTVNAYTNKKMHYSRHDRNRVSSRHLGCLGVYLIYAFIHSNKANKLMLRIGELCVSGYLLGTAYLINESYEDRRAFMELVPGGNYARYFVSLILLCGGICFISGYFLKDISLSVVFCLVFLLGVVDMRFSYWSYRGMQYWTQLRLAMDSANLVVGFFMFTSFYENIVGEDSLEQEETEGQETEEAEGSTGDHTKQE